MIETLLIEAARRAASLKDCMAQVLATMGHISKSDLVVFLLQDGRETHLFAWTGLRVRQEHLSECLDSTLPFHCAAFPRCSASSVWNSGSVTSVEQDFERLDLSGRRLADTWSILLSSNDGVNLGSLHLASFVNNLYQSEGIRERLSDYSLLAGKVISTAVSLDVARREADGLADVLGKFVPKEIISSLLENPNTVQETERRDICILFCDIRSFTAISEKNKADRVVAFLNNYFSLMVDALREQGATIDKFIGDAIVAMFGAPISQGDAALRAVRGAQRMLSRLSEVSTEGLLLPPGGLQIGIGIHCGDAIVGSIGSVEKLTYSALGEVVGMAEELEAYTKQLAVPLLFSDTVHSRIAGVFKCLECGEVNGHRIYRLLNP